MKLVKMVRSSTTPRLCLVKSVNASEYFEDSNLEIKQKV